MKMNAKIKPSKMISHIFAKTFKLRQKKYILNLKSSLKLIIKLTPWTNLNRNYGHDYLQIKSIRRYKTENTFETHIREITPF